MPEIEINANDTAKWLLSRGAMDLSDESIMAAAGKTDQPAMDAMFVKMLMQMRDCGALTDAIFNKHRTLA